MTGSARQDGRLLARLNSLSPSSDAHPAPLTCFSDQELDRRARTGSPARDAIGPMLAGSDPRRNCGSIRLRSSCRLRIRSTSGCTTSVTDVSSVTLLDLPSHARLWQMRFTSTHTSPERRRGTHYTLLKRAQSQREKHAEL